MSPFSKKSYPFLPALSYKRQAENVDDDDYDIHAMNAVGFYRLFRFQQM